jgi:alpha-beta hydrolase superfamily lysophospholipase
MRRVAVPLLLLLGVYAALCAGLYFGQRRLIYLPPPTATSAPAEPWWIERDGTRIKVWVVRPQATDAIVYFGGNAEDVGQYVEDLSALAPNAALYLVNYRGYGGSGGSPSETALLGDAEAIFDRVRKMHTAVSVIGRSLGSGVAVHLAAVRDVHKLVLITPFDSVETIAARAFAFFPVRWLLKDKFDSFAKAGRVRAPTLVLIAGLDDAIPRASTERLVTALNPPTIERLIIPGATHDSIADTREYADALRRFLGP